MFDDAVALGSLGAVAICIIIIVYLGIVAAKKINSDHSEDQFVMLKKRAQALFFCFIVVENKNNLKNKRKPMVFVVYLFTPFFCFFHPHIFLLKHFCFPSYVTHVTDSISNIEYTVQHSELDLRAGQIQ